MPYTAHQPFMCTPIILGKDIPISIIRNAMWFLNSTKQGGSGQNAWCGNDCTTRGTHVQWLKENCTLGTIQCAELEPKCFGNWSTGLTVQVPAPPYGVCWSRNATD